MRMPNSEHDDLIPSAEVARILRIDRATVTRWANVGRLHAVAKAPGLRGARLFRRADIEALLRESGAA